MILDINQMILRLLASFLFAVPVCLSWCFRLVTVLLVCCPESYRRCLSTGNIEARSSHTIVLGGGEFFHSGISVPSPLSLYSYVRLVVYRLSLYLTVFVEGVGTDAGEYSSLLDPEHVTACNK